MKILFAIPRMGGGGAERVTANLANSLAEKDIDVRIVSIVGGESFYPLSGKIKLAGAGITVNRKNRIRAICSQAGNFFKAYKFIQKNIKSEKPDIVISFLVETDIIVWLTRVFGCRFYHVASERNDPTVRARFVQKILGHIYSRADLFVCQSRRVADYYTCVPDKNKVVIPNPINKYIIPVFCESMRRKAIVSVGRLDGQKNFCLLIDAFYRIQDKFPEYKLEIYGEGRMRGDLQKKIDSLGLKEKVFLLGAKSNVTECICGAEMFVLSSDYEGFPNALLEAMAVGLPVISTDFFTGVAKELIGRENGIVVPVGDVKALSEAMTELLSDAERLKMMGEANRKVVDKYSIDRITAIWEDNINRIFGHREA